MTITDSCLRCWLATPSHLCFRRQIDSVMHQICNNDPASKIGTICCKQATAPYHWCLLQCLNEHPANGIAVAYAQGARVLPGRLSQHDPALPYTIRRRPLLLAGSSPHTVTRPTLQQAATPHFESLSLNGFLHVLQMLFIHSYSIAAPTFFLTGWFVWHAPGMQTFSCNPKTLAGTIQHSLSLCFSCRCITWEGSAALAAALLACCRVASLPTQLHS
jgi:hypothetical protein